MLVLVVEYIFLTTFYGLYFNHQLHITITISSINWTHCDITNTTFYWASKFKKANAYYSVLKRLNKTSLKDHGCWFGWVETDKWFWWEWKNSKIKTVCLRCFKIKVEVVKSVKTSNDYIAGNGSF